MSGGSGTRLWPLSNEARSKQFLRLLPVGDGDGCESMIQRVTRQLRSRWPSAETVMAISGAQRDAVTTQLGDTVRTVCEPSRRHTMAAVCLACEDMWRRGVPDDETVLVMPCDAWAGMDYVDALAAMVAAVDRGEAPLVLMGIRPTYPSAKYGYILPASGTERDGGAVPVEAFAERPDVPEAEYLISCGAMWNGGVFAFRLGWMTARMDTLSPGWREEGLRDRYDSLPDISFDAGVVTPVAEAGGAAMIPFEGAWKDLGTWLTLTDELRRETYGNVVTDGSGEGTHVINELDIPVMVIGTRDLVVAASPDGILVSEKSKSERVKSLARAIGGRPMYEERRWGTYKVIDSVRFGDGFCALTKQLTLHPGGAISYQRHNCREEVWTFIDGEGEIVLDGERRRVGRGDVVVIGRGRMHALRAVTTLTFIEVQNGTNLVEEDIERFPYEW